MMKFGKKWRIVSAAVIGVIALGFIFWPKPKAGDEPDEVEVTDSAEVERLVLEYGIPVDRYKVDYGIVERNQNLSSILSNHGLTSRNIHELNEKAKDVFDGRKIRD